MFSPAPRFATVFIALAAALCGAANDAETRAAAWLKAWDGHAPHRTGTAGDEAGAAWLAREAAALGATVTSEPFRLDRIDTIAAYVEFDGERITGEPLFDAPGTPADGIRGAASADAMSDAAIAVLPLPPSAVYGPEYKQMRRESRHRAQVIVTMGGAPGLALLNAEQFNAPVGPPTLQVSSLERERLLAAVARRAVLSVVVHTKLSPAEARNVVVTFPGRDRTRPPVVVMTPRSSWWVSTSERGGGLVCWLETLRALRANPPACDVIFTANTGHELGHTGLDAFVERRPGSETRYTWIHYGASIGATGSRLEIQSNQDDLRRLFTERLAAVKHPPARLADKSHVPSGETRDIHRAGGRYLTLVAPPASNPMFHLPQDRWPDAVDVPAIARIAEGVASAVVALTR